MKVLVACEFSGIVRDAFAEKGHDAYSCDLLDSERPGKHFKANILHVIRGAIGCDRWDLMIAHPPCTYLAVSGARWMKDRLPLVDDAAEFFMELVKAPIRRICIENPVCIMSTRYRKPDQIIQPWQFSHGETKATCLWLKNLPKLLPTKIVEGRTPRVHLAWPGPDRWKERSRTLQGIAKAMADQWGRIALPTSQFNAPSHRDNLEEQ